MIWTLFRSVRGAYTVECNPGHSISRPLVGPVVVT